MEVIKGKAGMPRGLSVWLVEEEEEDAGLKNVVKRRPMD